MGGCGYGGGGRQRAGKGKGKVCGGENESGEGEGTMNTVKKDEKEERASAILIVRPAVLVI